MVDQVKDTQVKTALTAKTPVLDDLAAKLKAKQIADSEQTVAESSKAAAAGDVNISMGVQQTASPFMPGAPASGPGAVASAGLATSVSGPQVLPAVTHPDDILKTGPEAAFDQAAKDRDTLAPSQRETTKPKLLSSSHVLFYSHRANFGASTPTGVVRFTDHWAQTDKPEQIEALKANAAHFGIKPA